MNQFEWNATELATGPAPRQATGDATERNGERPERDKAPPSPVPPDDQPKPSLTRPAA